MGAIRSIKNIKNTILDIQQLRSRIRDEDLETFDQRIASNKDDALREIKSFLGELLLICATIYLNILQGHHIFSHIVNLL